jgi:hypothetical protein
METINDQDLTFTILVDQTPEEVFNAINNVRGWWTENMEGDSQKLGDEFSVRFWDVHYSKQKLTRSIPGKKVVWLITDSKLTFIKDTSEWTGTSIVFDIDKQGDKTQLTFTHKGLVPEVECFGACSNAWGDYITKSLHSLITTGKGQPTQKED